MADADIQLLRRARKVEPEVVLHATLRG